MHCHHGPDPHRARSVDAAEAVAEAEALGMAAIVLKSHAYPTGPIAILMQKTVQRLRVFGGICCDFEVGGLNPAAVEVALRTGAKVVWMPTFSSVIDRRQLRLPGPGIAVIGERARPVPAAEEMLRLARPHDAVGARGHIELAEQFALLHAADPLRLGILGAAHTAPMALVRPAQRVREATVLAVAARDPERARQFAARHGIPRVHPSYDALLADPEIDAIYNPLPNSLHAPWTIRALAAGKHVLCEKPFAANAAEAEDMARPADPAGRVLVEAFHWRYHPLFARVRAILDAGEIGQVRHLEAHFCIPLPLPNDIRYRKDLVSGARSSLPCATGRRCRPGRRTRSGTCASSTRSTPRPGGGCSYRVSSRHPAIGPPPAATTATSQSFTCRAAHSPRSWRIASARKPKPWSRPPESCPPQG